MSSFQPRLRSSFQPRLRLRLFGILAITLLCTTCAGYSRVSDTIAKNKKDIQAGTLSVLDSISTSELSIANDTDEGILYYSGLVWFSNDKNTKALISFKRSARTGIDPWKKESTRIVGSIYSQDFNYKELFRFYSSLADLDYFASDPELFYYYSQALWSLKKYKALIELVQKTKQSNWRKTPRARVSVQESRFALKLWDLLSSAIEMPHDYEQKLIALIRDSAPYPLINSIPLFLERYPYYRPASQELFSLLKAKTKYLEDKRESLPLYTALSEQLLLSSVIQNEINSAAEKKKKNLASVFARLQKLESSANNTREKISLYGSLANLEYLRTRYRSSYQYSQKVLSIIDSSPSSTQLIRTNNVIFSQMLTNYLQTCITLYPNTFVSQFVTWVSQQSNPGSFAFLLERYSNYLLQKNRPTQLGKDLLTLQDVFSHVSIQFELDRWRSILLRSKHPSAEKIEAKSISFTQQKQYRSATAYDYFVIQSGLEKISLQDFLSQLPKEQKAFQENNDVDTLITGHIQFGLFDYAYNLGSQNIGRVSIENTKDISDFFLDQKDYYKGFLLANKVAWFRPWTMDSRENLRFIYPQAYKEIVESLSTDPYKKALIYGLMREESNYSPGIRSYAGAVGLTQLLPSTASEIAEKVRYGTFSIADPTDNLYLGYQYLQYLFDQLKNPARAILAYNGGIGNVWKWEKKILEEDSLLFSEAVPFRETRTYIRKVLSSALIYGLLYYDIDPQDLITYVNSRL